RVFPRPRSLFDAGLVRGLREVMSYRVGVGFYPVDVWVRVYETREGGYIYHVEEPRLNELEVSMYEDIMNLLYFEPPEPEDSSRFFEAVVKRIEELLLRYAAVYEGARTGFIRYYLYREALGFGYIDPLMRDPHIEDVSCNGYNLPVYVWHTNFEYVQTTMRIPEKDLDRLVLKLAHISGKHLSMANPIVDAILPGGHRLAGTYRKEVTTTGSSFTVRKFREKPISIVELIKFGTIDPFIAAYAWVMMEHKRNGLILGVTGAGKTTLLNAVATLIHPSYKVVTIEDTPELRLPLPNWVQLVSREFAMRTDIVTSITLFDLVKLSLRYRPEIIMVGEVRGEEAYVLFQAMASVSGDTPIVIRDSDGMVKFMSIGEFVDKYYEEGEGRVAKSVEGVQVLSHDGYNVAWKPLRYVLRHRADSIYRIVAEGGVELRATGSHSVYVLDPETLDVEVKRVDQLAPGDLLLTFVSEPRGGGGDYRDGGLVEVDSLGVLDEDMAFVFGVYITDGCVKHYRGSRICFTRGLSENSLADRMLRVMYEKFGVKPYVDGRGSYKIFEFNNTELARRFEKVLGGKLEEKRVPHALWSSSSKIVRAFFEGLKADSRRTFKERYVNYVTATERLAQELLWLARMKGFYAFLHVEKGTGRNVGREYYNVNVYLDTDYRKPDVAERVPAGSLLRLVKLLGLSSLPYNLEYIKRRKFVSVRTADKVVEWVGSRKILGNGVGEHVNRIKEYAAGNLRVVLVKEVSLESFDGYVYDVSVPGTESFIGGKVPVLLHNTGHGGVSTMHAESLESAVDRLTSPPMNIPPSYIPLIHFSMMIRRVDKGGKAARRVTNIWEVEDYGKYVEVFKWRASKDEFVSRLKNSVTLKRIAKELLDVPVSDLVYREIPVRALLFHSMALRNMISFKDVAEVISRYYHDPGMRDRILEESKDLAKKDESGTVKKLLDQVKR
ncbi:MAG: Flp pilus assembly complex ATPase component TadA, partial [Desulfurococcales archaeon]|nr:Flp pilus assembly complex ATPase component TadA [Desulfurococcales archaeon]